MARSTDGLRDLAESLSDTGAQIGFIQLPNLNPDLGGSDYATEGPCQTAIDGGCT